jgi:hypothetical protein
VKVVDFVPTTELTWDNTVQGEQIIERGVCDTNHNTKSSKLSKFEFVVETVDELSCASGNISDRDDDWGDDAAGGRNE